MRTRQMHRIVGLAGVLLAASTSQSQVTESWFRNFNYQNGPDVAVDVATDVYGSVYITGYADSGSLNQGLDMVTVKYDRDGTLKWFRPYDGPAGGDDKAVRIHVDALGNVIVLGTSAGNGTNRDFVVIKHRSSDGEPIWTSGPGFHFGAIRTTDTRDETASDLFVDAAGNVYVIGTVVASETDTDWKVIVFDQDQDNPGTVTLRQGWPVEVDADDAADEGKAIGVDSAGRVVGTGWATVNSTNALVSWRTYQWSASGAETWGLPAYRDFPSNPNQKFNRPYDLVIDYDDNIYICGSVDGNDDIGEVDLDMAAVSYTSSGTERWGVILTNNSLNERMLGHDEALAIGLEFDAACDAKRVFITGYVDQDRDVTTSATDYGTVALLAASGALALDEWPKRLNRAGFDDKSLAIAVRGKGNAYIAGWSEASSANPDYLTVAYGVSTFDTWLERWAAVKATGGPDEGKAVTVHGAGEALVTGQYAAEGSQIDYGTLLYKPEAQAASPDAVTVTAGTGSGSVSAFAAIDANRFSVAPDTSAIVPSQIVLEGSVPAGATELAFRLAVFVAELNILQTIELYNWDKNSYEQLDIERVAAMTEEERLTKMITVAAPCDPDPYITSTGRVKVRITHRNFTSLQPNPVIFDYGVWFYVN
ncbi:MAG: hypothetical protein AB1725_09910 [Armatimonadota bacterium]